MSTKPELPEIEAILNTSKDYFSIAKRGIEQEIRKAQIELDEVIEMFERDYANSLINDPKASNAHRKYRLSIKSFKLAKSALRSALAKINTERRAAMKPRSNKNDMAQTVQAVVQLVTAMNGYKQAKQNEAQAEVVITEPKVVKLDPVAEASFQNVEARIRAGESLKDISNIGKPGDEGKALLESLSSNRTPDITDMFEEEEENKE